MTTDNNASIKFGGFGKLPGQADFIQVTDHKRELEPLEKWIESAMHYSRLELTSSFESLYERHLYHGFVFRPDNSKSTLVGTIRAASDSHRRLFPFAAYAIVPTRLLDLHPTLITLLIESLFPELENRIVLAGSRNNLSEILDILTARSDTSLDLEEFDARYYAFLNDVSVNDLGQEAQLDGPSIINSLTAFLVTSRRNPRQTGLAVELPLRHSLELRPMELRFWIELYLLALNWYPATLSSVWSAVDESTRTCAFWLAPRPLPAVLLGALLSPEHGRSAAWAPGRNASPFGSIGGNGYRPPSNLTLGSLLRAVSPGYPDTCPWFKYGGNT